MQLIGIKVSLKIFLTCRSFATTLEFSSVLYCMKNLSPDLQYMYIIIISYIDTTLEENGMSTFSLCGSMKGDGG